MDGFAPSAAPPLSVNLTFALGSCSRFGGAKRTGFVDTTAPSESVTVATSRDLVPSKPSIGMLKRSMVPAPAASAACRLYSTVLLPLAKSTRLTATVPEKGATSSLVTKQLPPLPHVAMTSAKIEALYQYWSGFQRPPITCPGVWPTVPYSTEPQPPVGQISLYCHTMMPSWFCERRVSMSLLTLSACPIMHCHKCFLKTSAPTLSKSQWREPK
mmetsp:Transcript_27021/g.84079  ORF Transcript_27021/g.84079 Transcript_27021/m.84079 type:complete len:214 (+) Transcript_27021:306-947(+)